MPALSALVPAPLRPLARSVREYVRRLVPVTVDRPLDPADANATLNPLDTTYFVPQGGTFTCPVEVGNAGGVPWSSQGRHPIRLVASWLTSRNEPTDVPPQAIPLPCPVYPGRAVWVETRLTAPDAVGHYLIRFTLEQQGLGGVHIIFKWSASTT